PGRPDPGPTGSRLRARGVLCRGAAPHRGGPRGGRTRYRLSVLALPGPMKEAERVMSKRRKHKDRVPPDGHGGGNGVQVLYQRADPAPPPTAPPPSPRAGPPAPAAPAPPAVKVAILSFLFSWPSTGGGNVHTAALALFLARAGYDVRHLYARFPPWRIGAVKD